MTVVIPKVTIYLISIFFYIFGYIYIFVFQTEISVLFKKSQIQPFDIYHNSKQIDI